jgi:receptor expression-enhancing protein 5/6
VLKLTPLSAFYYTFKFILILWMALPVTGGAQIVFRSFIQPVFSRFFSQTGTTAADLRAKADAAGKSQ